MTIGQFKTDAIKKLRANSPSPELDIQVLMEFALNFDKTRLLLNRDQELSSKTEAWLVDAVEKRLTGLPIAYITGHKEFFSYDFLVTPDVLIPKPDTEILVERALDIIIGKMEANPNRLLTICDMCTGSGCIGLSVMKSLIEVYKLPVGQLPKFTLVDISPAALEIAEKNIAHLGLPRDMFRLVRSNLFEGFSGGWQAGKKLAEDEGNLTSQTKLLAEGGNFAREGEGFAPWGGDFATRENKFPTRSGWTFDLILTNPPYIPHTLVDQLLQDGRSEPRLALDGDVTLTGDRPYSADGSPKDDGLEIIRNLIPQAKSHLSPGGCILMETGEYNAKAAALIGQNYGFCTKIHTDLEGQFRVVEMF